MFYGRNNNVKREYELGVEDALNGKLSVGPEYLKDALLLTTALLTNNNTKLVCQKYNSDEMFVLGFGVINGTPDIARYGVMANEDQFDKNGLKSVGSALSIAPQELLKAMKEDFAKVEYVLAEALEDAYNNGHQFIYSTGIEYIYPKAPGQEGPIVITALVYEDEVLFRYSTTQSTNLAFKNDYAKVVKF